MNQQIAAAIAAHDKLTSAAADLQGSRVWARAEELDLYKNEMRELIVANEAEVKFAENDGKTVEEIGALYAKLAERVRALEAKKPAALTDAENDELDRLIAAHAAAYEEWADVSYNLRNAARKNADLRRAVLLEKNLPTDLMRQIRRDGERFPGSVIFYA